MAKIGALPIIFNLAHAIEMDKYIILATMKLKNLYLLPLSAFLMLLASCADDPAPVHTIDASSAEHTVVAETPTEATTLPAPGEGTTTAATETPLAATQTTMYAGADGSTMRVSNHFGDDGSAWIVVEKDGAAPVKLEQKEVWANGGIYSDGKQRWEAQGSSATLTEGKATVKYQAQISR